MIANDLDPAGSAMTGDRSSHSCTTFFLFVVLWVVKLGNPIIGTNREILVY